MNIFIQFSSSPLPTSLNLIPEDIVSRCLSVCALSIFAFELVTYSGKISTSLSFMSKYPSSHAIPTARPVTLLLME